MSAKKRGRPTKKEEISLEDKLAKCFGDGLSAPAAARIVGVDRKTAYNHYDEIVKQHKEKTFEDLFERQENDRVQMIAALDKDLEEVSELLNQIRSDKKLYLDKRKSIPKYLFDQEIDVMKYRSNIKDRKAAFVINLTLQEERRSMEEDTEDKDGKS
ncbi:MAG TPA: hypothetical protein VFU58_06580 [Candidatus Nitrosotalea sp.]|nr:hypothetical protein [Candidatus Nitrosotalea sp.]